MKRKILFQKEQERAVEDLEAWKERWKETHLSNCAIAENLCTFECWEEEPNEAFFCNIFLFFFDGFFLASSARSTKTKAGRRTIKSLAESLIKPNTQHFPSF